KRVSPWAISAVPVYMGDRPAPWRPTDVQCGGRFVQGRGAGGRQAAADPSCTRGWLLRRLHEPARVLAGGGVLVACAEHSHELRNDLVPIQPGDLRERG